MTLTFALIEDDTQPLRPTTLSDSRGAGRAVILPMLPLSWVNHIAPSGPGVMPNGLLPGGRGYSLVVRLGEPDSAVGPDSDPLRRASARHP